jgi:two-component system alkaline phosphatase synthesis response regulator PhoP
VTAEDGEGAIARTRVERPDLVLLDIMMPGIDGFQVMKYLSQFGVKVPVLAMSALGPRVEERARELGADGFIAKPFDIRELVVTSRRVIDQHAAVAASRRAAAAGDA